MGVQHINKQGELNNGSATAFSLNPSQDSVEPMMVVEPTTGYEGWGLPGGPREAGQQGCGLPWLYGLEPVTASLTSTYLGQNKEAQRPCRPAA